MTCTSFGYPKRILDDIVNNAKRQIIKELRFKTLNA